MINPYPDMSTTSYFQINPINHNPFMVYLHDLSAGGWQPKNNIWKIYVLAHGLIGILYIIYIFCRLLVAADSVRAVYKMATLLKMNRAAEACSRFLATNLKPSNCLGKLNLLS